jgi:hypothetical protein
MFLSFAARGRGSSRSGPPRPALRWFIRIVAVLAAIALVIGGLIALGHWGLAQLRSNDRYLVPLAALECQPPPALTREEFLDEVRYYSGLAEKVSLLDDDLPAHLRAAFAMHPWVAKVDEIEVVPPRQLKARLSYRTPVLAVRWNGVLRAVDGDGVLLPSRAPTRGLPTYDGTPRPPRGPEGTRWGDPDIEQEAHRVAAH